MNNFIFKTNDNGENVPKNKVLVCITPQSNSKRLIDKGGEVSAVTGGELAVLYVEKGNNVFATEQTPVILQEMFSYATQIGGTVTGLCGEDVFCTIKKFIADNRVTHIVFGESGADGASDHLQSFTDAFPYLDITVLPRLT